MTRLFLGVPLALIATILLLMPNLMRRGVMFAVSVADDFRTTQAGRRATFLYRVWVWLAFAVAVVLWLASPASLATALAPLVLFAVGMIAFYFVRRLVLPFAVHRKESQRSIDLTPKPERLPGWIWLGVCPFVVLALTGLFLSSHWQQIPANFPVHFGFDGMPDRWASRTFRGVYGVLIFGAVLCSWFMVLGVASWYGARRSSLRPRMLALLIMAGVWLSLLLASTSVQPLFHFPFWAIVIPALCAPFLVVVYLLRKSSEPSEPSEAPERSADDCWKAGIIYYNPADPVLFVEKRLGFGYTLNFGNRWSWALGAGLIAVLATIPAFLS